MQLLFFGLLAEIAGKTELEINSVADTDQLKRKIIGEHPALSNHSFLIAVNKKVCMENVFLQNEDVVAFLPPFSGG